jgi:hypothetical protein
VTNERNSGEIFNLPMECVCGVVLPESLLSRYLNCHTFTELSLDGIFKYGDDNTLPSEVQ